MGNLKTTMKKTIKNWIVKYFSNILAVLSLLTTIFFGYFFVPVIYTEYKEYKQNYALNQVVESTKELIYSDSISDYEEVKNLIESKQSSLNESLNKSTSWYLLNASNSFTEDKFLSLFKRRELNAEILEILSKVPSEENVKTEVSKASNIWIWIISIFITSLILGLGIYSFIKKLTNRKNTDEELINELEQLSTEKRPNDEHSGYIFFEENLLSALNQLNYKFKKSYRNLEGNEFDVKFIYEGRNYFVETKFLQRSKVGLKTILSFLSKVELYQGVGIFVHNTDLTTLSKKRLQEFNQERSDLKIHNIRFINEETLVEQIKSIVSKTA